MRKNFRLLLLSFVFSGFLFPSVFANTSTEINPILGNSVYRNTSGELFALSGQSVKVFFESQNIAEDFQGYLHCYIGDQAQDTNIEVFIKQETPDYIWCTVPITNDTEPTKVTVFLTESPIDPDGPAPYLESESSLHLFINADADNDLDGIPDSVDPDDDSDELSDDLENSIGSNPLHPDTDDDGVDDFTEYESGMNLNNSDTDSDGISDQDELYTYNTDPTDTDTDNDGIQDGRELPVGGDPLDPNTDDDCFNDAEELAEGTSLTEPDTELCENLANPEWVALQNSPLQNTPDEPKSILKKIQNKFGVFRGSTKIDPQDNPLDQPLQYTYRGSRKIDPQDNPLDQPLLRTYRGSQKISKYSNPLEPNPYSGVYRGKRTIGKIPTLNIVSVETPDVPKKTIEKEQIGSIEVSTQEDYGIYALYILIALLPIIGGVYLGVKKRKK